MKNFRKLLFILLADILILRVESLSNESIQDPTGLIPNSFETNASQFIVPAESKKQTTSSGLSIVKKLLNDLKLRLTGNNVIVKQDDIAQDEMQDETSHKSSPFYWSTSTYKPRWHGEIYYDTVDDEKAQSDGMVDQDYFALPG